MMVPGWLVTTAEAYLAVSVIRAAVILVDLIARGHAQAMRIG